MEAQFWIDSWNEGGHKTSFHRRDIHPYVQQFTPAAMLAGKRVLVPLCGKTNDLMWYREYAEHVIGVELVETAILQFFDEQGLAYTRRDAGRFVYFEAERLLMICGDYFALQPADVGRIDLVYDRASLIALPYDMRMRYLETTDRLMSPGATKLLITLEYAPLLAEPPFSVAPDEVAEYYRNGYTIEHVADPEIPNHGMIRRYGLKFVKEHGFLVHKHGARTMRRAERRQMASAQAIYAAI